MLTTNQIISPETEKLFPFLKEKLIFDFVNGLQVSKELNTVKKQRSSLWARFSDSLSGKGKMRQDHLNDHFITGLEACHHLILELSKDIQHNAIALNEINQSLQKTQRNIAELAHYTANIQERLSDLASTVNQELKDIKQYLDQISRRVLINEQIDRSFNCWGAGGFKDLHPLGRCYAVVDAIYWGAIGRESIIDKDKLEDLKNRLIIQLKNDFNLSDSTKNIYYEDWLAMPESENQKEILDILQFQGDWCWQNPQLFVVTFMATQHLALKAPEKSVSFPIIIDIDRVANRMVNNIFSEVKIR